MPIVSGAAWFNSGARPMLKVRAGDVTADVEQGDVASCALTSETLAAGSVTCTALAAGHVVSEKASANLRHNTYTVVVDKQTASSSEGWSSTYVLWRPRINVNVLQVTHVALGVYENATCDNWTLYGNQGTCIGQVALKTVSTGIAAGTRTAGSAITQAALAAGTDVLVKLTGSTCSVPSRSLFVIDYESTG